MDTNTVTTLNTISLTRLALLAKGMSTATLAQYDTEELEALEKGLKVQYVNDPQAAVEAALATIREKKTFHKLVGLPDALAFEESGIASPELIEAYLAGMVEKKRARLAERAHNSGIRLDNRALYQPQYTLRLYEAMIDGYPRYRTMYSESLDSLGLMARWAQERGETGLASLRILNELPEEFDSAEPESYWMDFVGALGSQGWVVTGSQSGDSSMAWNYNLQTVKEYFAKAFPLAIDMGAYNHRLGSPLLPGGYFEAEVTFITPMGYDIDRDTGEATQAAIAEILGKDVWFQRPMGCDGSGQYNPNHPSMQDLVARYGKVVFQFTALDDQGFFAKGILVPREDLPETVGIALDPLQVKGAFKGKCEENTTRKVTVGVMKAWYRPSTYPGNFEVLQFMERPKDKEGAAEMKNDLDSLVTEAIAQLVKKGPEGMLDELIKGDEHLKLVTKLLAQLRGFGKDIKPMDVPLLKSVIDDGLGKALWVVANGAGFYGDQKVVVIDNTLEPGTCVTDGIRIGKECAIWRYPCALPQGLVTATTVKPRPHHMVDGKIVANTIWLPASAIVLGMQGDDDGDIVGVSIDPRVLRLWKRAYKVGPFSIENAPQKLKIKAETPEGREYIARNNRGPVGFTTIAQAKCLAVGDIWGAIAMAVSNQEAVDSAKKAFIWADFNKLSDSAWWVKGEDGIYRPRPGFEGNYELGSPFPMDDLKDWHQARQKQFGVIRNAKEGIKHEVLAWRWEAPMVPMGKKVRPSALVTCDKKSGGAPHRNIVHYVHDRMVIEWKKVEAQWMGQAGVPASPKTWMREILSKQGLSYNVPQTYREYAPIRKAAGLEAFGKSMKSAMGLHEETERIAALDRCFRDLHGVLATRPIEDLLAIWEWENTPVWKLRDGSFVTEDPKDGSFSVTKANNAYRAVAFPGSPILALLGIEDAQLCSWANSHKEAVARWALNRQTPWKDLSEWFFKDLKHGDAVKTPEKHRIELSACQDCTNQLGAWVLKVFRANKRQEAGEELKNLIQSVNRDLAVLPVKSKEEKALKDFNIQDDYDTLGEQ